MTSVEAIFFWLTIGLYFIAIVGFFVGMAFRRQQMTRWAVAATSIGLLAHSITVGARWTVTGHPPLMGDYESSLARAWFVIGVYLFLQWRRPNLRVIGTVVVPFSVLMMGYGFMRVPRLEPLLPPFQSYWLWVHVSFAWMTYAAFVVAGGMAGLYLWRRRRTHNSIGGNTEVPLAILDDLSYRLITCGFIAASAMLVSGAIWANSTWGSYWSWDPIQVWALLSWLVYGVYIHLRATMGWRETRAAWLAVANLATVIISYFGVNYVGAGLHIF